MKRICVNNVAVILAATMFVVLFMSCKNKTTSATKSVDTGVVWEVGETTSLSSLTIAEDATVKAPEGKCLTMTVGGVEKRITPGTYNGDIVLTVTNEFQLPPIMGGGPPEGEGGGPPGGDDVAFEEAQGDAPSGDMTVGGGVPPGGFRTAIYIDGGVYVPEKSVTAAVPKGEVTNNSATDISISSTSEDFYGIIVMGDSKYSISNLEIDFNGGEQGNYGYGITTFENADVTVNNASIICKGVQRAAIAVGGNSTIHVNDSYIETHDGILPENLANMETSNSLEVPWVLGFIGNNRATNVVQNGTAYYNNSHFRTQRWGCLSTDAAQEVKLYATNCRLETIESGYGAYHIGDSSITSFDGCTFDVHDYGLIMTGGGTSTFTNGSVVNSGRFGIMAHQTDVGELIIEKGCVFNTESAVIQLKSACPAILVDNAELNSKNGIILEAIVNDDPWMSNMPGGDMGMPGSDMGMRGGDMGMPGPAKSNHVANVTFRDMTLNGDIVDSMTSENDLAVNFERVTITGAITTATSESQASIDGVEISKKTYYYVGALKHTYCATDDKYGVKVSLDDKSKWIVDKTSYLTGLTIAEGGSIIAPEGFSLTMKVNDIKTIIGPGTYTGKIEIIVTKS
jgi:hypothetical protein